MNPTVAMFAMVEVPGVDVVGGVGSGGSVDAFVSSAVGLRCAVAGRDGMEFAATTSPGELSVVADSPGKESRTGAKESIGLEGSVEDSAAAMGIKNVFGSPALTDSRAVVAVAAVMGSATTRKALKPSGEIQTTVCTFGFLVFRFAHDWLERWLDSCCELRLFATTHETRTKGFTDFLLRLHLV